MPRFSFLIAHAMQRRPESGTLVSGKHPSASIDPLVREESPRVMRPLQILDSMTLAPHVLVVIALLAIALLAGCVSHSTDERRAAAGSGSGDSVAAASEAPPAPAPRTFAVSSSVSASSIRTESARLNGALVATASDSPAAGGDSSLIRTRFMRLAQVTGMFAEANKRLAEAISQFNPDQDKDVGNRNAGPKAALAAIEQFLAFARLALADFAAVGDVDVPGASNEQGCLTELIARLEALRQSGVPTREQVAETLRWYCQCTGMTTPAGR